MLVKWIDCMFNFLVGEDIILICIGLYNIKSCCLSWGN